MTIDSVFNKLKVLKGAKNLRNKDEDGEYMNVDFANVFISNDFTKEERDKRHKLRQELAERKAKGEVDIVIYGGQIMDKKDIQNKKAVVSSREAGNTPAFRR